MAPPRKPLSRSHIVMWARVAVVIVSAYLQIRKEKECARRPSFRNEVIPSAATPPRDFSALALFSHDVPDSADPPAEQYSRGPTNKDLSYEIRGRGSGIRRREREKGLCDGLFFWRRRRNRMYPQTLCRHAKIRKIGPSAPFPRLFRSQFGGDYGSKITQPRADLTSVRKGRDKIGSPTHTHTHAART